MNHVWQSTLFAGLVWLVTIALRRNPASVRHWLWFTASAKFLVPFSLLVALGSHSPVSTGTRPAPPLALVIEQIAEPLPPIQSAVAAAPMQSRAIDPLMLLAGVWALGFATIATRWVGEWWRMRGIIGRAARLDLDTPVRAVCTKARVEPGVFGIVRPVLLMPEGIRERLSAAEFSAIVAHELCHVRRRDNLFAAIQMLVEAVFWFHPLVWWMGNRLVEERERACDEEVLRRTGQPQIYAEGILKVCEHYLGSPLPCVAGVSGADLRKRIERIMDQRVVQDLRRATKLLLGGAGALALALPVAVGALGPSSLRAQGSTGQARPAFEVASVKINRSGAAAWRINPITGNRFAATNIGVGNLIQTSYRVLPFQVSGGPSWLYSDRFDIEAKAEGDAPLAMDQARLMLQRLLEDRFQLRLHHETKEMSIYELQVAKGGIKFKEGTCVGQPGPTNPCGGFMLSTRGKLTGRVAEMPGLASLLAGYLGRAIIDKTSLTGKYDLDLTWTPDENMPKGPGDVGQAPPDPNGPSLFTALEEQLGLRLESSKGPVDMLVLDHVEKPSGN